MAETEIKKASFRDPLLQAEYDRQGYLLLDRYLRDDDLDCLQGFYESCRDIYNIGYYASTLAVNGNSNHRREVDRCFERCTKTVADDLLDDYRQYYGGFGVKHPTGSQCILDTHQDITMVPYDSRRTGITLWVPLCDVDSENGCVQVFPGSHNLNRRARAPHTPFAYESIEQQIVDRHLLDVHMRKGQILIMDQALIHRSGPNISNEVRVAIMGMFTPVETRLVYYHRTEREGVPWLEAYEVPIDFYLEQELGKPPYCGKKIGAQPESFEQFRVPSGFDSERQWNKLDAR